MPLAALHYCFWPGCPEKVSSRFCATHAVAQEHRRPNYDVRRWYRTARWRALRWDVLRETPLCEDCKAKGRVTVATDVHHRARHEGDEARFFDRANLGALCAACHSRRTQMGE